MAECCLPADYADAMAIGLCTAFSWAIAAGTLLTFGLLLG